MGRGTGARKARGVWKRHMKRWLLTVLLGVAVGFGAETQGRTVREALEVLLATEYCGTAISDGVGITVNGKAHVKGEGGVALSEEEWGPVLLEMAKEEMEQYLAVTRLGTPSVMPGQGASNPFPVRLSRMMALMQTMTTCKEEALEIIERIALECPHSEGLGIAAMLAWMRLTLSDGEVDRCLQLASKFREKFGEGSGAEWELCCLLVFPGLGWCDSLKTKARLTNWLLTMVEECEDYSRCNRFDREAAARLYGWVGSVQRKRLAERFRNEPPRGRFVEWNEESGKWERTPPTEEDAADMLASRAAAELAADESELTDLREVYGDWTTEKAGE